MDVTLYLEKNDNFEYSNEYDNYYDEKSYIQALEESYNQTKDAINEGMNYGFYNLFKGNDKSLNTFTLFNNKTSGKALKRSYTSCKSEILSESFKDLSVDDLVKYMVDNDVFILVFNLDLDSSDDEFEEEFKLWYNTFLNIKRTDYDDNWKDNNYPKNDIRIKFKNNIGTDSFALLKNCRFVDYIDKYGYAILVERISFINDISYE